METGRTMILHSLIIGIVLYLILIYVVGQKENVAENQSILSASLILAYMITFGHDLPTTINKDLF